MQQNQNQLDVKIREMDEKIIDKLVDCYNTYIQTELENERKKQQKWIEKQYEFSKSFTITFDCSISKKKVKTPVTFKQCATNCKHFDDYFDLKELLIYVDIFETKPRKISCPSCQEQIHFQNKKDKLEILKELFVPQVLIFTLRKQVGIFPKEVVYFHKQNLIIPLYRGKLKEYFNKNYSSDYAIENILLQPLNPERQFFSIAKQLNDYQGCDFANICSLSSIRVNIPIRGNQCVHYECYDLVGLHKYMVENQIQHLKCSQENCESVFNLQKPETFCIDHDLLKAGREGLSFSINFTYIPHYNILSEILTKNQRDEFVISYRYTNDQNFNLEYLNKIYEMSEQIFLNNENNKKETEAFYKKFADFNENDQYQLSNCPINQLGIEVPARCKNCKSVRVTDLRYLVCILHQIKNEEDVKGVKAFQVACPLCKSPFQKTPKPPLKFLDQIYIDVKMLKFFIHSPFFKRQIKEYQIFLKQQNQKQPKFIINENQVLGFKEIQYRVWAEVQHLYMYKINLRCLMTGNQLKIPLRSSNCAIHYDCFDYASVQQQLNEGFDLEKYQCPNCQKKIEKISNLFVDKNLADTMEREKDLISKCQSIIFRPSMGKFLQC